MLLVFPYLVGYYDIYDHGLIYPNLTGGLNPYWSYKDLYDDTRKEEKLLSLSKWRPSLGNQKLSFLVAIKDID